MALKPRVGQFLMLELGTVDARPMTAPGVFALRLLVTPIFPVRE
jgi:hypothetical protein